MKKSLIALAVLAASGAAMAQSSVSVYGIADIWLGSVKGEVVDGAEKTSVRNTALESGGVNTSRIGFKGTEDLGGGLKANFQIETSIALDQPSSTSLGNRTAFVGLSGGFGAVELGKNWTSYDDIRASANDSFNANVAASFNTWLGYEDNPNNVIKYVTPEFNGFSGSVTYSLGEDKTATTSASSIYGLGAQYANGPLFVGFAHQTQKQNGTNGVFSAVPGIAAAVLSEDQLDDLSAELGAGVQGKTTYNLINGSYDFGVAKLVAGYNQVKQTFVGSTDNVKANEWNLGVEVPLAANLKGSLGYASSKLKGNGTELLRPLVTPLP